MTGCILVGVLITVVTLAVLICTIDRIAAARALNTARALDAAYERGFTAAECYVSAESSPYEDEGLRLRWLDGWLDGWVDRKGSTK